MIKDPPPSLFSDLLSLSTLSFADNTHAISRSLVEGLNPHIHLNPPELLESH